MRKCGWNCIQSPSGELSCKLKSNLRIVKWTSSHRFHPEVMFFQNGTMSSAVAFDQSAANYSCCKEGGNIPETRGNTWFVLILLSLHLHLENKQVKLPGLRPCFFYIVWRQTSLLWLPACLASPLGFGWPKVTGPPPPVLECTSVISTLAAEPAVVRPCFSTVQSPNSVS